MKLRTSLIVSLLTTAACFTSADAKAEWVDLSALNAAPNASAMDANCEFRLKSFHQSSQNGKVTTFFYANDVTRQETSNGAWARMTFLIGNDQPNYFKTAAPLPSNVTWSVPTEIWLGISPGLAPYLAGRYKTTTGDVFLRLNPVTATESATLQQRCDTGFPQSIPSISATSTSNYGASYLASNTVDNNLMTIWMAPSSTATEVLLLDLNGEYKLSELELAWSGSMPKGGTMSVAVSSNGLTFRTIHSGLSGNLPRISLLGERATHVRLEFQRPNGGSVGFTNINVEGTR